MKDTLIKEIILVDLNNFQEYILTNIQQLCRLGHKKIYVLTNGNLFHNFINVLDSIQLINVDLLHDSYNFTNQCNIDWGFRGGFWHLTSLRFFYIYEFIAYILQRNYVLDFAIFLDEYSRESPT